MYCTSLQVDKGTKWDKIHQTLGDHTKLPASVDLRPGFHNAGIEVYDQGHLKSCTANALCAAWRYVQSRIDGGFEPSRLFVFYNERKIEGKADQDVGARLSDGCKSLETFGVCSEDKWPYDLKKELVEPPKSAYHEGKEHVIHTPAKISNNNLNNLKDSLVQHKPFMAGIALYDEFMGDKVRHTGVVPMPAPKSKRHGFHAVTCVGYNDAKGHWIFRNSWGPNWGDKGHFYLPYEYLKVEDHLATDFWNLATDPKEGVTTN